MSLSLGQYQILQRMKKRAEENGELILSSPETQLLVDILDDFNGRLVELESLMEEKK